jgi:redox-sensitive bicupin YhaK (pirin superfamily)
MSSFATETTPTSIDATGSRQVVNLTRAQPATDGAGVRMKRLQGAPDLRGFDPFLMLDEFKSDDPSAYIGGFPDHPHRGFETVTYLLAGRMRHEDNHGGNGLLGPGGVQWMTAGRGIVHSEMPEQENGLLWGFQLWLNLPASEKMTTAGYRDISAAEIPIVDLAPGVSAKLIAGEIAGQTGPGRAAGTAQTTPVYLDLTLTANASATITLPAALTAFAYVYEGSAEIGAGDSRVAVGAGNLATLGAGATVDLRAGSETGSRLLLLAGRPLDEPIAHYGPFVMNTEAEIHAAVADYRADRF